MDCLDKDGERVWFPLDWTDAGGDEDPFLVASAGRSYFHIDGLLQLVELVKALKSK